MQIGRNEPAAQPIGTVRARVATQRAARYPPPHTRASLPLVLIRERLRCNAARVKRFVVGAGSINRSRSLPSWSSPRAAPPNTRGRVTP
jgi:hypothetical protein